MVFALSRVRVRVRYVFCFAFFCMLGIYSSIMMGYLLFRPASRDVPNWVILDDSVE